MGFVFLNRGMIKWQREKVVRKNQQKQKEKQHQI